MKQTTALLVLLAACADQPGVDTLEQPNLQTEAGDPVPASMTNFCRTVTVSGKVFYNDLRTDGRFSIRDTQTAGVAGTGEPFGTADNLNYLALRDAQVDIYEVDRLYGSGASCAPTTKYGTTTVDRTGAFTWTGQICETCGADVDGGQDADLSVGVKVSLRQCDDPAERCFSVRNSPPNDVSHWDDNWDAPIWSKWVANASDTAPKQFHGTTAAVGTDYFQSSPTDLTARAANVFASLVDVTRKVHTQLGVAFGHDEVAAYFPHTATHSHESGRLCVSDSPTWSGGYEAMHEYGHLLHYWAWGGFGKWFSYCFNEILSPAGCLELYTTQEYANTAFKEGWADFVAGVALDGTNSSRGCDTMESDGNLLGCPGSLCQTGRHYFRDVTRVLCDVWDEPEDCTTVQVQANARNATNCDRTNKTLSGMVADLADEWTHARADDIFVVVNADIDHPAVLPAFGICDYYDELDDPNIAQTFAVSGLTCE